MCSTDSTLKLFSGIFHFTNKTFINLALIYLFTVFSSQSAIADSLPGGTMDPTSIPKYVTPLVIPPVMKNTNANNNYLIAQRQFKQQILPGGIWNTLNGRSDAFPATTVWSYGPDVDGIPDSRQLGGGLGIAPALNSQFNYPAYTIEATRNTTTTVTWMNELVADPVACASSRRKATDPACNYLSHILPVDRSLHWANPEQLPCMHHNKTKDCRPMDNALLAYPYNGPVPMVPHVHGAHVGAESDGYPEAWWLPAANNIPVTYAKTGTLVNQYGLVTNSKDGQATFKYPNTQPSTTLWYHDHTLGMTRNNVYAGPAGFWLIRGINQTETGLISGVLPGPAPAPGDDLKATNFPGTPTKPRRERFREIPIVIQDRSFNNDGSLFYPANRAFFEGLGNGQESGPMANINNNLNINTLGTGPSDISPIWNPEAFFNVMVVNGVSWPTHDVAQAMYRFRLLNGCNSRFLNLALFVVDPSNNQVTDQEIPFYQIGAEQGLLPKVVKIQTGFRTILPGNGTVPQPAPAAAPEMALLMGLAERADVLVDFSGLPAGTRVRMINTGPDAPFGGFPVNPVADPATTGQVMEFVVNATLNGTGKTDPGTRKPATAPEKLVLSLPDANDPANGPVQNSKRDLALIEEESALVCIRVDVTTNYITQIHDVFPDPKNPGGCIDSIGNPADAIPFAPKAAVLGVNGSTGGNITLWGDPVVTNPALGATETWEIWNITEDAHPIHLHLVKFKVINRETFDPINLQLSNIAIAAEANETGWKDTVIAYPGQVTRVNATFDIPGLYVWHCHIVEHEDNEMMVPYCVGDKATAPGCTVVP